MTEIELKGFKGLFDLDKMLETGEKFPEIEQHILKIDIDNIVPNPNQPRKSFDLDELNGLADSIKSQGILQPIIVRQIDGKYEIVAGERRWRAAQIAEIKQVPVICRKLSNQTVLVFSLLENIQRSNLNPIDEALAVQRLIDEFKLTHESISRYLGKSRSTITNILRLHKLNEDVKLMLQAGQIEVGHAKILLALENSQQLIVAKLIIEKNLTVRETEKYIKNNLFNNTKLESNDNFFHEKISKLSDRLSNSLHSKVSIKVNQKGEGRVVINFSSLDEVNWLVEKLEK